MRGSRRAHGGRSSGSNGEHGNNGKHGKRGLDSDQRKVFRYVGEDQPGLEEYIRTGKVPYFAGMIPSTPDVMGHGMPSAVDAMPTGTFGGSVAETPIAEIDPSKRKGSRPIIADASPFITDPEIAFKDVFRSRESKEAEGLTPPEHVDIAMFSYASPEFYRYMQQMFGLPENFWRDQELRMKIIDATTPPHIALIAKEMGVETPIYLKTARQIDDYFYGMYAERFEMPYETEDDRENVENFFFENQDYASDAMHDFLMKTMPKRVNHFDERTEVRLNKRRPSDLLHYLFSPDVHPTLKFELQRQLLLAHVSAEIAMMERSYKLGKALKRMQDMFDIYLFDGKIGEVGPQITIRALHDRDTNEAIAIGGAVPPAVRQPKNTIEKEYPFRMRRARVPITEIDPSTGEKKTTIRLIDVHTHAHKKDRVSAILKIVRRAEEERKKERQGVLDPAIHVQDMIRMRFIVNGDENDLSVFRKRVHEIVRNPISQQFIGRLKPEPYDIIDDSKTNGTAGQSPSYNCKRDLVHLAELPRYIEFKYFTPKDHIDAQYEVGTKVNDRWSGASWRIMKAYELMEVLDTLLPNRFYGHIPNPNYLRNIVLEHVDDIVEQQRHELIAT